MGVSQTIFPAWASKLILQISVFQVARIISMSHLHWQEFLTYLQETLMMLASGFYFKLTEISFDVLNFA
jgi:hypothetical protein